MDEHILVEKLHMFGLGRQEALIYLCLLRNTGLSGYEVAKLTGISRSNVYSALAGLVEHGAAYVMESNAVKYCAVEVTEFCDNRIRQMEKEKICLEENMPKSVLPNEGYISLTGFEHICNRIHHMLENTQKRIYFSASAEFLLLWKEELMQMACSGKKIVLLSKDSRESLGELTDQMGDVVFYQIPTQLLEASYESREQQVRLIIDSQYVLTGEVSGKTTDTCLYCAQRNFVNVFKDAMRNEIELIKIRKEEAR